MPNSVPKSVSLMQIFTNEVKDYYQQHQDLITEDLIDNLRKAGNYGKQIALDILDMDTDDEGYYLDAFGNQVHYRGNRYLKAPYTKFKLSDIHVSELKKCAEDIEYFKDNYIKIKTKSGFDFPEIRDYQNEFLSVINNPKNESIVALMSRQSGKSVTIGIYLTWLFTFKKDMNIGICANRWSLGKELLNNISNMYLSLPIWMKQGIRSWNTGTSINNENNMRIIIDTPSANSFRGYSCNVLIVDECIAGDSIISLIDSNKQIYIDTIARFYQYFQCKDVSSYKIFTSNGWKHFDGFSKTIRSNGLRLVLQDNVCLECTPDHKLYDHGKFKYASDFEVGDEVQFNCTLRKRINKIVPINTEQDYYDAINVQGGHHFTANGVEVSNCAFIPPYRWEEFADSFFPSQSALGWKKNIIISTANGLNHFYKIVQGAKLNKVVEDLVGNEQVQLEDGTITTLEEVYQSGKFTNFANLVSGAA